LQLWLAFLLVCLLSGLGTTVYQRQRANRFRQIDSELQVRVSALTKLIRHYYRAAPGPGSHRGPGPHGPRDSPGHGPPHGPPRYPPPPKPPHRPQEAEPKLGVISSSAPKDDLPSFEGAALLGTSAYYFVIWYRDGYELLRSDNAPHYVPGPQKGQYDRLPQYRTRGAFREALHCSSLGECVLAGRLVTADLKAMRGFGWKLLAAGSVVLALGLSTGWWVTTRAIRPIEEISAAASRISQGNLTERVRVPNRGDEFSELGIVLNSSFEKLQSAFARQQQFTADAAHELRSLVTALITESQTALSRERTAADYRETVVADLDTAQQMRRLTESLLELASFEADDETIERSAIDLAEIGRSCVERIGPLAAQHRIRMQADFRPAPVISVADRLDHVITNLLTNAILYNKIEGDVLITTFTNGSAVVLTVADSGVGIAAGDLPHIFDRFYRVNKAHSRAEGHVGLGLAICKAIVGAERGTIEVASTEEIGTTFTVRLPHA
jgi:two-component system OmpR family sensor kinase